MTSLHTPAILTGKQLAELFQIPYDEKHLAGLRGDAGLPHLRFRQGKDWYFRYPTSAVMEWVVQRTHTKKKR